MKLTGPVPRDASLWYGYGLDPHCNLTDGLDMAVPVFGPIDLDEIARRPGRHGDRPLRAAPKQRAMRPVKVLIITGDTVSAHNWKERRPS